MATVVDAIAENTTTPSPSRTSSRTRRTGRMLSPGRACVPLTFISTPRESGDPDVGMTDWWFDFVRPGLRPLTEACGLAPGKERQNWRSSGRETSSYDFVLR
jgi:hypothetical protein